MQRLPTRTDIWQRLFNILARSWGVHPLMIPRRHWQVLLTTQLGEERLREVLRRITNLETWPDTWEIVGREEEAAGHVESAGLCYYIAQRLMVVPSEQKARLYTRAADLYVQTYGYEKELVEAEGGRVACLWQETNKQAKGVALLLPGVTFTKEELHYHALLYAQHNYHVVRIDNPVYGETEGSLLQLGLNYPRAVIDRIRKRWPDLPVYMHGISYGGYITLHNADYADAWSVLSAPYNAAPYFHRLPLHSRQALQAMFGDPTQSVREWITSAPVPETAGLIIHGGKDRTVPASEARLIAQHPNSLVSILRKEGHSCPNRFHAVGALNLEWFSRGKIPTPFVPDNY